MKTFTRNGNEYIKNDNGKYYRLNANEYTEITAEEYETARNIEQPKAVTENKPLFDTEEDRQQWLKEMNEMVWDVVTR